MIGGKIVSHEVDSNEIVTFTVKENEGYNECFVKAKMNAFAQNLIDDGAQIWWDSENVYLTIGDITDCKFSKIGFTY